MSRIVGIKSVFAEICHHIIMWFSPTEVERRLTDSCLDYLYGQFRDWLRLISLGSNLIFYGFGSKYDLLETFRQEMLSDFTQLVIRGYQPGFTLKSFLETLAKGLKVELPPSYATGRQKSSHLDILQYIK